MPDAEPQAQEPRTERATVMLTVDEKRAVRLVAAARDVTESDLLRSTGLGAIMEAYEQIRPLVDRSVA